MSYITCKELIDFLDDYVADELPPPRRHEFERHLSVCPSCVEYVKSYRVTIQFARRAYPDPAEIPPELLTALVAAVARNTGR